MPVNSDKPHLWKADIDASVDLFNEWFMGFAPKAYRDTRLTTTRQVEQALLLTEDLATITPALLRASPEVLPTLRMATCPPLARDRLIGLSRASRNLVLRMEAGKISDRIAEIEMDGQLSRICKTTNSMLDVDIFPWLIQNRTPTEPERYRAATIVADRLCGATSDPIIRNEQENRQLARIGCFLEERGYEHRQHPPSRSLHEMEPGTYAVRMVVVAGKDRKVNIPMDVVIQPKRVSPDRIPILIEAKSAGDFTNVNKRRKEEATKVRQIRGTYGDHVRFLLFLCGYFDAGYLGYEAAEGIDWVWEHRITDLDKLGL